PGAASPLDLPVRTLRRDAPARSVLDDDGLDRQRCQLLDQARALVEADAAVGAQARCQLRATQPPAPGTAADVVGDDERLLDRRLADADRLEAERCATNESVAVARPRAGAV